MPSDSESDFFSFDPLIHPGLQTSLIQLENIYKIVEIRHKNQFHDDIPDYLE